MDILERQNEISEELNNRLDALHQELRTMNIAVKHGLNRRRKRKARLGFPFSLLDRLINAGLFSLEHLVRRLVLAIFR